MNGYGIGESPKKVVILPTKLREISGLALSGEGKLFTHNDEKGVVYQLDLMTGRIIKKFYLVMDIGKGKRCVKDDF
ncbi:MAG: hypothetical protein HGA46_11425, partial [Chlorobiaceae bacterium]|nr:hypothetical protein [Chlorobiaceae bacterium]